MKLGVMASVRGEAVTSIHRGWGKRCLAPGLYRHALEVKGPECDRRRGG
jgi:hypothetical protein